jgi:hypothetical protein
MTMPKEVSAGTVEINELGFMYIGDAKLSAGFTLRYIGWNKQGTHHHVMIVSEFIRIIPTHDAHVQQFSAQSAVGWVSEIAPETRALLSSPRTKINQRSPIAEKGLRGSRHRPN